MNERENELRDEIRSITSWLPEASADESVAARLTRTQMERRVTKLNEQLDDALNRVIELHFDDAHRPAASALSTPVLSTILGRLQSTLTFGTWAITAGSDVRGNVPAAIERTSRTEVVATPPGSFRLVIRKQRLELAPAFDQSVASIFEVAQAAASGDLGDDAEGQVMSLGREATRRLELLFKKLAEEDLDTSLTWSSPDSRREVFVSHDVADTLSKWLADAVPSIEIVTVQGYLRRADTMNGAFRVEDAATGRLYEGTSDPVVLAHAEMDALYDVQIETLSQTSPHTGRVVEKLRLVRLEPAPD